MTPPMLPRKIKILAGDIKIAHTVFAMPFALMSALVASDGSPGWGKITLIALCMVFARTAAMTANRLLDAKLDAKNPRTASRAIPSGKLAPREMLGVLAASCLLFIITTAGFLPYANPLPLIFAVPVLGIVLAYPLLKRFTRLCHYYLGMCLAMAPVCAWGAMTGNLRLAPLLLAGAVLLWTGGFDILYACLDYESDVQNGVFSIPSKLGIAKALWAARITHLAAASLLFATMVYVPRFGTIYFSGACLASLLLIIEHTLVNPGNLSNMNTAFFTLNGILSATLCALGILDIYI
jgi:4-hydroxybenzoate polyprenyltransferase